MVSVVSTTGNYILQPETIKKHAATLEWLSSAQFWKSELLFFQKILDTRVSHFTKIADKKKIDHFQSLITYYRGELVDVLRRKLRKHENHLAAMLRTKDETNTRYFTEHNSVMDELQSFSDAYSVFKKEFLEFLGDREAAVKQS